MANKPEALIIVFDIGKSMQNNTSEFEGAKACIKKFIIRKIYKETKDDVALILIGDDSKVVEDADEDCGSENQNISIAQGLKPANWKLYKLVNDIKSSNIATDFIRDSALDVAINLLQNTVDVKKIGSKRIVFLSNFDGWFYSHNRDMISNELKACNIELDVITPSAQRLLAIKREEIPPEFEFETKEKYHVLELVKEADGNSFSFRDVLIQLSYYQMKSVQPTPSNVNLDIGTLSIPISVYMKITESKPKPWTTASAHGDGGKPKRTITYCMNDENQTKVSPEDSISAYKYGTTLVPFSEEDKKNMEYESGGKGMKLLGFTKASNIKRHLYVGNNVKYVYGHKNDESAKEAVAAFAKALSETNMVAIVRFVATARSTPVVGFLSPRFTTESECLSFITLPFMEDIRYFVFTSLNSDPKNIPSDEQLDAIDDLITCMDLTTLPPQEDDEFLNPKNPPNPYVQRLFHCIEMRALHPEKPLPRIQPHISALVNPKPNLLRRAEESFEKVRCLFPMKECMRKKLSEPESEFPQRKSEDTAIKNLKNEDSSEIKFNITEANLIDAVTDKITKVGTVDPVRDIQYLTTHQSLPFDEICKQIHNVVHKFLDDSDHLKFNFPKVLSVLKEYRSTSLKEASCEKYNSFMWSLQDRLLEIDELWDKIKNEKIGLISNLELPSSSVSPERAELYLSIDLIEDIQDALESSLKPSVPDDDENLMDEL